MPVICGAGSGRLGIRKLQRRRLEREVINRIYGGIEKFNHAAFKFSIVCMPLGLCWVAFLVGRLVVSANTRQASSAGGTSLIHAGSSGGQLATRAAKVPLFLAAAIFSGTAQRETYQQKRGESGLMLATA